MDGGGGMRQGREGGQHGVCDKASHRHGQLELHPAGERREPVWTVPGDPPEGADGDASVS